MTLKAKDIKPLLSRGWGGFKTIAKNGFSAVQMGKFALENPTIQTENVAQKRLEICKNCPDFQTEPIPFLRIKDEKIPELSEKYCKNVAVPCPIKPVRTYKLAPNGTNRF